MFGTVEFEALLAVLLNLGWLVSSVECGWLGQFLVMWGDGSVLFNVGRYEQFRGMLVVGKFHWNVGRYEQFCKRWGLPEIILYTICSLSILININF